MDLTAARPDRRLVIVVRADPVICGHSGEARNLAEAALHRGFDDVRIVTWPIDRLQQAGLPLKPLDSVTPYSPGIVVERPAPIGDYKVPDGRYLAGLTGRLVELFTDAVPTVAMSLYLSPHATAIADAVAVARRTGLPVDVVTIAEAVGSDVTNVVRACVENDQFGAAAHVLAQYLSHDVVLAVSQYTRDLVVTEATAIDARHGTRFADQCRERINVSYPAIDVGAYLARDEDETDRVLADRGLTRDGYVLFLSRLAHAKGVDDLIDGYVRSGAPAAGRRLVIAGNGPQAAELRAHAARTPVADLITFLDDVPDDEKGHLMAGCTAFVLPSKPRPEFIETFGIALVEKMLSGGGPVITTVTGGIGEAVGDTAIIVPVDDPDAIAAAIDDVLAMDRAERAAWAERAREYALRFDRGVVLDRILERVASVTWAPALA
ncbi:glycosyltransferase [Cellulomonas wangsupingiae]|uniref:Glycosyltransferase n=1 Tax=Cellulomonas wangsupingiae TaxID=2968085 RepID=A0ABY5K4K1_9CELL|nr:glycosyltransferase [Cellulomonas wangsupingiae]MCC2333638.1 glycosyltransferase [Cellulomonas wangsupingiae]UUI64905.1 glycosyltransferase [Cellulomonas wangsupingiae]